MKLFMLLLLIILVIFEAVYCTLPLRYADDYPEFFCSSYLLVN